MNNTNTYNFIPTIELNRKQRKALATLIEEQSLDNEVWQQALRYYTRVGDYSLLGYHFISNKGRFVKITKQGNLRFLGKINKRGYMQSHIKMAEKTLTILIHRLVYFTFCYVPSLYFTKRNKFVVHHINTDRLDNNAYNLIMLDRSTHNVVHQHLGVNSSEL